MLHRAWSITCAIAVAAIMLSAASGPARADAIDGDWCFGSHHMLIEGNTIVTPSRNKLEGRYTRYGFSYVVPANEQGAGTEITMVMIRGQEVVHLRRGQQTEQPEVWRRCKPIS